MFLTPSLNDEIFHIILSVPQMDTLMGLNNVMEKESMKTLLGAFSSEYPNNVILWDWTLGQRELGDSYGVILANGGQFLV